MAKALKTKAKFFTDAKKLLKDGYNPADLQDFAHEYQNVTADDIQSVLKSTQINSAVNVQIERDKKEAQRIYNNIDNMFIEKYPNLVAFEQDENISFYDYKDGVYIRLTKNTLKDRIHTMFVDNNLLDFRTRAKVDDTLSRIVSLLQYENKKRFNQKYFETREWYINVKNGLLNPKTRELIDHTPAYFSTSQTSFNYDPDAVCPKFLSAVQLSARNAEGTDRMLQEAFGYMIATNGNPSHKIFYLYGRVARNGKSTMAQILIGLCGYDNVSTLSIENLSSQSDSILTPIVGKHMNFSDEANASKFLDSGRLTSMTAQGPITISPKFEAPFSYTVRSKFLVACNYLPNFQSPQGMKQRTIIIPFNYFIPPEDRIYDYDKILLQEEGSGILNWALDGYHMLAEQKMQFTISELSKEDSEEIAKGNDSVLSFLDIEMDISLEEYTHKITTKTLYDRYVSYCANYGHGKAKGFRSFAQSMKTFAEETNSIQYHSKDPRGYSGLSFKEPLYNLTQQ